MRIAAVLAAGLLAAACDPASTSNPTPASSSLKSDTAAAQAFPVGEIPADAGTNGMWSPVMHWPMIPIHVILLPDGRVLSFGSNTDGNPTGYFVYDLWAPSAGFGSDSHLTLPNHTATDLFCASQIMLPDGAGALLSGGDNWTGNGHTNTGNPNTNILNYNDDTLTRATNMNRGRWYASSTTMLNGEIYIQGGISGIDRPEVRTVDGTFRLLSTVDTNSLRYYYPRNYVVLDGRIFGYDTFGKMYYIDPAGTGTITSAGSFDGAYQGDDSSSAMFAPGRILQFGGNSNAAIVIDVSQGGTPVVTTTHSVSSQRRLVTATLLPNGQVLATGGSEKYNELVGVNNSAEAWSPVPGTWKKGASGALARLYHSTALLMPDATVLVGGGGGPGPLNNLNVEVFYPPYLFTSDGALAARPRIAAAPASLQVGRSFALTFADAAAIGRVVLVKTGAQTHGFNMDQRFVDLPFSASGTQLSVQMPSRPSDAPPGYYLLFVLTPEGVPSIARTEWLSVAAAPDPGQAPTIVNPGNRYTATGDAVAFPVSASDPNGDVLAYTAAGLPPGVTLDRATGEVGGNPAAPGAYNVVIAVSDGVRTASADFTWRVSGDALPLTIDPLPPPVPVLADQSVHFTGHASNGINTLYKWNFGDGTADTAFAASADVTHRFPGPGVYFITLTASDSRGVETQSTFMQLVHRPLTANLPTQSSDLAYEARPTGPSRLWVVNQDNDSVSVLDAGSGARIAEIEVGAAPRSIAIAGTGRIWVTNKRSASISVIDPDTLAVVRTLKLPYGSQPHGVAMTPKGTTAFVALEATGELLKINTRSFRQLAAIDVGPHPRQVSVGSGGGTVYVSRFITPPQPGEDTAHVQSNLDGMDTGGEVVRVRAGDMSIVGTTILHYSRRPDFETQGRGVPNYLGAVAVSPDGTQAFVPSKQDNIQRGTLRDHNDLNFQNTVRAVSSRIDLRNFHENAAQRIDHDNAGVASAAVFDPYGVFLFVALEASRDVALVDANSRHELLRFSAGRAPQGVAISADGDQLFVSNLMDRSISVFDLRPLLRQGSLRVPMLGTWLPITTEKLSARAFRGKQLFYDARDRRLARDRYLSCASCHNDGGQDGRVWDFSGFGEGLRNTIALRGRAGTGQGFLHWSNNFDEVQDFEMQIRNFAGGTGLMSDADFLAGTRSEPLGQPKAGLSSDLDALAAYLESLDTFDASPFRASATTSSAAAAAGKAVFAAKGCASCHGGPAYTDSGANTLVDIGTIKPTSGHRLGGELTGIDVPTLRDVWATAPYLHDGSAKTLGDAVRAHAGVVIGDEDLGTLVSFLKSIGREEPAP